MSISASPITSNAPASDRILRATGAAKATEGSTSVAPTSSGSKPAGAKAARDTTAPLTSEDLVARASPTTSALSRGTSSTPVRDAVRASTATKEPARGAKAAPDAATVGAAHVTRAGPVSAVALAAPARATTVDSLAAADSTMDPTLSDNPTHRTTVQSQALDEIVHSVTDDDGNGANGARLRLLYGTLHPDDRPRALQAIGPYRDRIRDIVVHFPPRHPDAYPGELRRHHDRLHEVGVKQDALNTSATEATSANARRTFSRMLTMITRFHLEPPVPKLRSQFVAMSTEDRLAAQAELEAARRSEAERIGLLPSNKDGQKPESAFEVLRSLSNIDAPVRAGEVSSLPGYRAPATSPQ